MLERLTDKARMVAVNAQSQARQLGHDHIGVEHLLLALAVTPDRAAQGTLNAFGLTASAVREQIVDQLGEGADANGSAAHFTPEAAAVLELGSQEALDLHHNVITPGHLLLGLAHSPGPVASGILAAAGIRSDELRQRVTELIQADTVQLTTQPHGSTRILESLMPPAQQPQRRAGPDAQLRRLLADSEAAALAQGRGSYGLPDLLRATLAVPATRELLTTILRDTA